MLAFCLIWPCAVTIRHWGIVARAGLRENSFVRTSKPGDGMIRFLRYTWLAQLLTLGAVGFGFAQQSADASQGAAQAGP